MILNENMKPIEHVLLHPVCVFSHMTCACKHCNVKLSLYYWTHWSCWRVYHFKKTDFTRFFIIKPRHTGRERFRQRGALGHLSFWSPAQAWPIWPFVWKAWKCASRMCSAPSKISFVVPTLVLGLS